MGIYTKKGDTGITDMLSGIRIDKSHPYIELLGSIDELTSHIGFVKVLFDDEYKNELHLIQEKLMMVMGVISNEFKTKPDLTFDIKNFESSIDQFQSLYPKQDKFIIPGSDELSARLDIARTKARLAERKLIQLKLKSDAFYEVIQYFNRLSDYLYALARMIEFRKKVMDMMKPMDSEKPKGLHQQLMMTLELAKEISQKVEQKAQSIGAQVVVCITNNQGRPILVHGMDQTFIISFDLAQKKAFTSAAVKMPTHELGDLTKAGADFENLEDMISEDIVTLGGGFPLIYKDDIIGAIGVSGSTVDHDRELARYATTLLER